MIKSVDINRVSNRLKQGIMNDEHFGNISIAWVGDPGQIPPVGGLPGWVNKTRDKRNITGMPYRVIICTCQLKR
jgi:hypothetical protein